MAKVVLAMSGGVDSSVAALILQRAGHEVIGLFMKNWEGSGEECSVREDFSDVTAVCHQLDIPYYAVNFVDSYREKVFSPFLHGYERGETPNPDILCNREIKFSLLFDKALSLGADYLATGHYCRENGGKLLRGRDRRKDQSYFLYTLSKERLERILFPLGEKDKSEVRALAGREELATACKKESMGICCIGKCKFASFLSQYLSPSEGIIETIEGKPVGRHMGVAYYTIGQRRGLGIGGEGTGWFVVKKDAMRNVLVVAPGNDHSALYADSLTLSDLHWIAGIAPSLSLPLTAKVRYRQMDQPCSLSNLSEESVQVHFSTPQRALAVGQSVVFYSGQICLGGGVISMVAPSYYEQNRSLPF